MKKSFILLLFLISQVVLSSQELKGKWILKEAGYKEHKKNVGLTILNFDQEKVSLITDLKTTNPEQDLKIKDSTLFMENDKKYAHFKLIENKVLRLFMKGTFNDKEVPMELDFIPLLPTKTSLNKTAIEELRFEFKDVDSENSLIAFNEELMDPEVWAQLNWKEGSKMIIEQLEHTFFVTIYSNGKKRATLPISEVNEKVLILYCTPNPTGEIIATRVN